jgi:nitronate monooxygenase
MAGGHLGFKKEQIYDPDFSLEKIVPDVLTTIHQYEERFNCEIPVIAAGGIWERNDIVKMTELGADGVQLGTRFIGTVECDASEIFKQTIIEAEEEDIKLFKSPVGYPARGVKTELHRRIEEGTAPRISCVSNCVAPCHRGEEAKQVGYCIADRLGDAYEGKTETGLFFTGANGYRLKEIITVRELMDKLLHGE